MQECTYFSYFFFPIKFSYNAKRSIVHGQVFLMTSKIQSKLKIELCLCLDTQANFTTLNKCMIRYALFRMHTCIFLYKTANGSKTRPSKSGNYGHRIWHCISEWTKLNIPCNVQLSSQHKLSLLPNHLLE